MSRSISDVGWEMDGTILISYLDSEDIRCEGHVAVRHTIRIEPTDQYADGIQRLADVAQTLVADALQDWSGSSSVPAGVPERPLVDPRVNPEPAADEADDDEDTLSERRKWAAIEAARAPR